MEVARRAVCRCGAVVVGRRLVNDRAKGARKDMVVVAAADEYGDKNVIYASIAIAVDIKMILAPIPFISCCLH